MESATPKVLHEISGKEMLHHVIDASNPFQMILRLYSIIKPPEFKGRLRVDIRISSFIPKMWRILQELGEHCEGLSPNMRKPSY